jgi:Holliday junction resolvasome RuvABC DNA-binding subunit
MPSRCTNLPYQPPQQLSLRRIKLLNPHSLAISNLGYKEPFVRKAMAGLDASGGVSMEGLLKQALKTLMK